MSRNRFEILLSNLHFTENTSISPKDRQGKIINLMDKLQEKYQKVYTPGENIVIDETLIPWRGRLIFRQYIPSKAHKYGIKMFKLCSSEGFTWAYKIYSGKSSEAIRQDANGKKMQRACKRCYNNDRQSMGRSKARETVKRSFTYCPSCPDQPQLCDECFKIVHQK
uniref:piggyBac transposable element-derived protein 4-like n=1 Tax=Anopheles coluzzii TaxID=1518534 RepID=UPI0020FFCCF6|nr:piggyBac transposable element-derived protein 4-like [Anopheles coluzzii]